MNPQFPEILQSILTQPTLNQLQMMIGPVDIYIFLNRRFIIQNNRNGLQQIFPTSCCPAWCRRNIIRWFIQAMGRMKYLVVTCIFIKPLTPKSFTKSQLENWTNYTCLIAYVPTNQCQHGVLKRACHFQTKILWMLPCALILKIKCVVTAKWKKRFYVHHLKGICLKKFYGGKKSNSLTVSVTHGSIV